MVLLAPMLIVMFLLTAGRWRYAMVELYRHRAGGQWRCDELPLAG